MTLVIEGCAIATVDAAGTEHATGHLVVDGAGSPPSAPGRRPRRGGAPPHRRPRLPRHAGPRQLPPPPLPVGHARARASTATLFEWLVDALPGLGAASTPRSCAPPRAPGSPRSRARAARPRPTTTTSSRAAAATCSRSRSRRRARLGAALPPVPRLDGPRRSRDGGLPPDEVVEDRDAILAASEAAIDRFHDPAPGAMVRIALAPCSPFSVTRRADARDRRARPPRAACGCTPTWPRPSTRRSSASSASACRPVEYLEDLGWLGDDVWLAHCVHLDDAEIARFGETGTGVAHCPTLQRAARRRHRAGRATCSTPARRSASASTARRPTSRASWSTSCAQALLLARAWPAARRR